MNQKDVLLALDSCEISMRASFPDAKSLRAIRDERKVSKSAKVSHVLWMIDQARDFAHEDRLPKAFRWLGFIQGVMWTLGIVTIDEAKEANRPKEHP